MKINNLMPKKINLGSGRDIKSGFYNVDFSNFEGVDKIIDLDLFPWDLPSNYFEEIIMDNVLEHLNNIPIVMEEIYRIASENSEIKIIVPYYNCEGAYNDLTHRHFFSRNSLRPFYELNTRSNYFVKPKFKLNRFIVHPTRVGKILVFSRLQILFSYFFGQVIHQLEWNLKTIK